MRFKLTILHGNVALGSNPLFGGAPKVGDDDYEAECRIDDAKVRVEALSSVKNLVDEMQIVDPKERRLVDTRAKTED